MQWEAKLRNLLDRAFRKLRLERLPLGQEGGFPAEYRLLVPPRRAVRDVLRIEEAARIGRESVELRPPIGEARHQLRIYGLQERSLDQVMPILQNLGLRVADQIQFKVTFCGKLFFVRSFSVETIVGDVESLSRSKKPLLGALDALLSGQAEDDALNALILTTGLGWMEVDLFRAYRNYYLQLGGQFGKLRFHQSLLRNLEVARLLHRYFEARFRPDAPWRDSRQREVEALTPIRMELLSALEKVADVNDDRVLRDLFNLIDATLRTNFYYRQTQSDQFISLKISSLGVIDMPSPKPLVEIYVHSRMIEGVHLRGAKVARGGIRWSDRLDDFRSEILGLMQTQMVKNALIVPQGAKGGFILKTPCRNPSECAALALAGYETFLRGLLDLTDNMQGSRVVSPPHAVTYDDPDPYLVVAPDKGTASWSDRANDIAAEYGYWLGDAFATGGSHGYHHKRLGITARGAWVCIERHFRESGQVLGGNPITVVGVGSMDGDVFGNGLLHSNNILLLAAFNADHIFLDPDPDPTTSFIERKRLFDLSGSTWLNYDQSLISAGGGVFRRAAKDIPLSLNVRAWLGTRSRSVDGEELIRLLLKAPVDLLWMGGVGVYVKASSESNEFVRDRANDGARVDAIQLRAKVVGEGANHGFTQKARIEYALTGGRINTDAVDNSAGVDLSDHEVNLKILMTGSTSGGVMATGREERNDFLATLADDVCRSVLANNYRQSLCLSLERDRCLKDAIPFMNVADQIENAGLLDRAVESFPLRKEIMARAGQGLTRPELAVLMAHAKLALKRALLNTPKFLDGEWTRKILASYFPERARSRFADRINRHPVAREISATMICNKVIDQAGVGVLAWAEELDPDLLTQAVALYLTFDQILEGDRWREAVFAMDEKTTAKHQYELLLRLESALAFLCRWAAERGRRLLPDPDAIHQWRADLRQYVDYVGESAEFSVLNSANFDGPRMVALSSLRNFPHLVDLSRSSHQTVQTAAKLFDAVNDLLGLHNVATLLAEAKARDIWERRLQSALDDRFRSAAARLSQMELRIGVHDVTEFFRHLGMNSRLAKFQRLRAELVEASPTALAPFAALGGELDSLIDACGVSAGFE
jgi:glutamate dehydrogenase